MAGYGKATASSLLRGVVIVSAQAQEYQRTLQHIVEEIGRRADLEEKTTARWIADQWDKMGV
jgi:hypothetical protein